MVVLGGGSRGEVGRPPGDSNKRGGGGGGGEEPDNKKSAAPPEVTPKPARGAQEVRSCCGVMR